MPRYSDKSAAALATCHPLLVRVFKRVIQFYDHAILYGYRSDELQNELFKLGRSKLRGGQSKHNVRPSLAVDAVPHPLDWNDYNAFYHFAGIVRGVAEVELAGTGAMIRWGGDWDQDNDLHDQDFMDLAHFELVFT